MTDAPSPAATPVSSGHRFEVRQYRKLLKYMKEDFAPVTGLEKVASGTPLGAVAVVLLIGIFAFGAVFLRVASQS